MNAGDPTFTQADLVNKPKRRNPIQWHGAAPKGGFAQIPNSLLRDRTLSVYARCAAALLYTHNCGFEVSVVSLAEAMDCSRPTATKALKQLQEAGWLVIQEHATPRGTRAYSTYHLPRSEPFRDDECASLRAGEKDKSTLGSTGVAPRVSIGERRNKDARRTATTAGDQSVGRAERLVKCCLSAMPEKVCSPLINQVAGLLIEGQPSEIIGAALLKWGDRPESRPGILPFLVSDVIKERNAGPRAVVKEARSTGNMGELRSFGYYWQAPDVPDGVHSVGEVREFMKKAKSDWLDKVSADIESKWKRQLCSAVVAANPGVDQTSIEEILFK